MAKTPSVNVDSEALEHLDAASSGELYHVCHFLKNGHFLRAISAWAYFLTVNDHSHFIDSSVKLARLSAAIKNAFNNENRLADPKHLQFQLELMELRSDILEGYNDILKNHTKTLYRTLNNNRPAMTNPILRLMLNVVSFQSNLAVEFIDNFDLTLTILPNLLVPPKGQEGPNIASKDHLSIRHNFIRFWTTLCGALPSRLRKDLLVNKPKILNNLWKYMALSDSVETLTTILKWIDADILKEPNFKRSTKCAILNDNFMFKLQLIFDRLQDETFTEQYIQFVKQLCSEANGLLFPNNQCLLTTNFGVPLTLNGKTFKVHNKLLFTFLTTLKAVESYQQLSIVTEYLAKCPELIPPYLNWCVQNGGGHHDPSLTSWWVSRSLLISEVLKIKLPTELLKSDYLDILLLFECICPAPLSKGAISNGLDFKNGLCLQITRQLLLQILKVLNSTCSYLNANQKATLSELVFDSIPEVDHVGQSVRNFLTDKNDKLVYLTSLKILHYYVTLFPASIPRPKGFSLISKLAQSSITTMTSISDISDFSNFDLICLNKMLEMHSIEQSELELKWWSASKGHNSLFTTLLRLLVASPRSTQSKIYNTISSLMDNTLMLREDSIASPIECFVLLCRKVDSKDIYTLIDLSLAFCIKTPFKYLDMSHEKYHDVSPLVVTVFEQFKFNKLKEVVRWLKYLSRGLIVIGESKDGLTNLWQSFLPAEDVTNVFLYEPEPCGEDADFAEYISNKSVKDVLKDKSFKKQILHSPMDFSALWYFIRHSVRESSLDKNMGLFTELASKAAQFLIYEVPISKSAERFIFKKEFWGPLLFTTDDLSQEMSSAITNSSSLLNEIYLTIYESMTNDKRESLKDTEFVKFVVLCLRDSVQFSESDQALVCEFSWILCNSTVLELLEEDLGTFVIKSLLNLVIERKLTLPVDTFARLIEKTDFNSTELNLCVQNGLVHISEQLTRKLANVVIASERNFPLLEIISKLHKTSDIIDIVTKNVDKFLNTPSSILITASICDYKAIEANESFKELLLKVLPYVHTHMKSEDIELVWESCLRVLTSSIDVGCLSVKESFELVVDVLRKRTSSLAFNCQFIKFILQVFKKGELISEAIPWLQGILLLITKRFAEFEIQDEFFDKIIDSLNLLLPILNKQSWRLLANKILDTQVEVILRHKTWLKKELYLRYISIIIYYLELKSNEASKFLQIFINNDANVLRVPFSTNSAARSYSSLIIALLYFRNIKQASRALQSNLVCLYSGSLSAEDVLLKAVLQHIEATINYSWANDITGWEVTDLVNESDLALISEDPLVKKTKDTFTVKLSKNFLNQTIARGPVPDVPVPNVLEILTEKNSHDPVGSFESIETYFAENEYYFESLFTSFCYDPEFIAMMSLCHADFSSYGKGDAEAETLNFNVRHIVDSGVLQILIMNIGNEKYLSIVIEILGAISKQDLNDEKFKDAAIFRVYLHIVINTLIKKIEIPSLIWNLYGELIPILRNPGHFLYDKVCRFVLSNPALRAHDIPLYHSITTSQAPEGTIPVDNYYKEVNWLLQLLSCATSSKDLRIITKQGIVEWTFDLLNSPYISPKTLQEILAFFHKIQSIDYGNDMFLTRFGSLSHIEQLLCTKKWKNKETSEQFEINLKKLLLRLGTSQLTKRTREWTGGDNYIKRICR